MDKQSTTGNPTTVTDLLSAVKGSPVGHKVASSITTEIITESQGNPGTMYLTPSGIMMAGFIIAEANAINDVNATRSEDGLISLTKTSADGGAATTYIDNIATASYVDNEIKAKFKANDAMMLVATVNASQSGGIIPKNSINEYLYTIEGNTRSPESIGTSIAFSEFIQYFALSPGYTLRVTNPGTITFPDSSTSGTGSITVEAGDMIVFTQTRARDTSSHVVRDNFTVIQNNVDVATSTAIGLVKVPTSNGLSVDSDGVISMNKMTLSDFGTAKLTYDTPHPDDDAWWNNRRPQPISENTTDRWYGITANKNGNLLVNVPWTDTGVQNVVVNAAQSGGTTGITVSVNGVSGSTTLPFANSSAAGLMSGADKSKLDAVAAGAQVNKIEKLAVSYFNGSESQTTELPISSDKTVTIPLNDVFKYETGKFGVRVVTNSTPGLMLPTDKLKLDGIASGAQVNVIEGIQVHQGSSYHEIQTANKTAHISFGDGFKLGNPDQTQDVLLNFKTYTSPNNSGGIGMILKLQDNVTSGSDLATWNIPLVTTSTSGIMSSSDKGVLDTAVQTVSNSTKSGTAVTLNQINNGSVPTTAISATSGTDGIITFAQYKQIINALFWN